MPSWKKVIISGSDASLNSLNIATALTASGLIYPSTDGTTGQAIVTDGSGNLSFTDISATTDTGSLLVTASAAGSTVTFEKGDGSTFDVTLTTSATSADALVTASIAGSTLTFEKGDTSTFDIIIPGGGYSGSNATAHLNQTFAATTWSFAHNLDDRYPVFTVFDDSGDIIVPNRVETVDNNNANIYFTTARTGTATAVIASSISQISSITSDFTNQTTVAVTHSLDTRNIHVSVYDENYALIIPESIVLDTLDTVVVTFPVAKSGTVVVAKGGHIISGSADQAATASYIASSNVDGPLGMNSILSASYSLTSSYNENATISGSFTINDFVWPTTDGTYGVEVLTTDGSGGLSFEIPTNVYETVKNVSGGPLLKGTPVHATGSATSGNVVGVIAADAIDPSKMPATYILHQNLADEEEGLGIAVGFINGVDTRGLVEGEPVYVAAGGGWTQTKPTGSALIQNLGIVTKVAENGSGVVLGAGRSNDVPNITEGYAWVGNSDQVATATPTASFFVTSGSHALNADNAISSSYADYALDTAHAATADEAINSDTLDYLDSTQFVRSDQSGTLTGDLTVTGTLTAQEFHTEFVSASIIYQSGSTKFGDSSDDVHSFTGSIQVLGDITGSINPTGHLLPSTTNLYDLGSPTQQWRDLYLSSASLYVDGVKIISSDANVLTFTTDNGQSIKILEQGSDDITLQTENGNIELKGTVEITSGKKIIDSAGTVIQFGDSLGVTGSITTSGTVNGINLQAFSSSVETRVSDLELFSSSLNVESSSYALSSSYAVSASYAISSSHSVTASYIDPTFISASAAAEGFGQGGVTSIIAGSGISINQGTGDVTITALAASGSQGQNVIAPFAFAFVDTTSNGSGTGISWGNWNGSNYTLDFTFTTAQPNTNYSVITDSETFDDYFVGISNKTTTGFRAEFYDNSQSRTPSSFSPFTFFIYGSDPIATVGVAVTGSLVSTGSLSSNTLTFTKGDGTTFGIDLSSIQPTSASHAVTASYIDPTFISASAAASGFGAGGGGGTGDGFPYVGDAVITGSLLVSGSYISGSFKGDGSQLTGIDVGAVASVSDTFTSQTQVVVTHNFNSKDVNVAVYNSSDEYIIPDNITLTNFNTVTVDFAVPTSGRIVVSKGGHILSGIGLNTKAGSVATSSFAATGSSFYYDVVFDAPFASTNYTVGLQAHSQFSVPDSFPGHAWVDSDKATTGFRIVVPSFDSSMDEISWTAVAHGESNVTASSALTSSYVEFDNVANKPTLISSSLQFNTFDTPFTGSFTGSFYGDGSNLSGVTSYTDADTLSFIQGYSGSYSGSFVGDGSQLSGVTSYTDADTLAYINSLAVVSGSSITGSFTGSFFGDGTGLTGLGYGDTKKLNQTVAATTWSFNHNMNEQYPTVTVYNELNEVVQPTKIEAVSTSTLNLYFGIPTAGTAVAVVGGVALTQEAGFNRTLSQAVAATTWSFAHNLGQKYPQITVYDVNDELIIPGKVEAIDQNNAIIYFDTPQAGTVAATVGGTAMTASYSDTLTIVDTLLSTQENTDVDTGTETVATVSTTLYDGAFFDYVIKDGTNYRAGTVMAVWDGTSVQYNDNSTADIGDTSGVTLAVDISGTDARLRATVSSDNWNIKAFVRAL